jgi:hypothetical protein
VCKLRELGYAFCENMSDRSNVAEVLNLGAEKYTVMGWHQQLINTSLQVDLRQW